ncbi:hypothetical protein FBY51_0977 [Zymomonas mobilis]|nr:hypothetical protein ZZ6_1287 [Zymomonas mobilis subsp. mobilis ATCC 29191]TQK77395.1 hypothetical protein FBY53_0001 [Zymomonas mobilis]TQL14719.1 hypothetical protein FBY51_1579 [Zymomonas mobilis]TQL15949.1 hypothetical protein FBY51_0977 [Zymomonas mobilis]GEB88336.1 hypothetical protein ZMO01_16760 [Zymomonas mobilis subsp. mobilis]
MVRLNFDIYNLGFIDTVCHHNWNINRIHREVALNPTASLTAL